MPDFFAEHDVPDAKEAAAWSDVLEFDCLTIPGDARGSAGPWRPAWDEEHGLRVLVYGGQTVEVDNLTYFPAEAELWGPWNESVMNADENAALEPPGSERRTGTGRTGRLPR